MRIISFSVENFRSFNKKQTIVFNHDEHNVNAIIGPNASGKTNFMNALCFMTHHIQYSTRFSNIPLFFEPFVLKIDNENNPTSFSIEIENDRYRYNYSFSMIRNIIQSERLKRTNSNRASSTPETIFSRKSIINRAYEKYGFDTNLLKTTREDALVITRAFEVNNPIAVEFFGLINHINFYPNLYNENLNDITTKYIDNNPEYKEKVLNLLKNSDLNIVDLNVQQTIIPDEVINKLPVIDELKKSMSRKGFQISTSHILRDQNNSIIGIRNLSMQNHESSGTNKIYNLACHLINALSNGETIYIDELESSLHINEYIYLMSLFKNNENGASLITNTHYVDVMDIIGRKNIHLLKKNTYEESIVGKIPSESRNTSLAKKYKLGVFGYTPAIRRS